MDEQALETFELDMEEQNELLFSVNVEGASAPVRVRLVCEAEDMSYMFDGQPTLEKGVVQFLIPEMASKLRSEGTCGARIEVLVDNRYFTPVQFEINFKKAVKVFAEAVQVPQMKRTTGISVSAAPITVIKPIRQKQVSKPEPVTIAAPEKPKKGSLKEKWMRRGEHDPEIPRNHDENVNIDEAVLRSLVKRQLTSRGRKK